MGTSSRGPSPSLPGCLANFVVDNPWLLLASAKRSSDMQLQSSSCCNLASNSPRSLSSGIFEPAGSGTGIRRVEHCRCNSWMFAFSHLWADRKKRRKIASSLHHCRSVSEKPNLQQSSARFKAVSPALLTQKASARKASSKRQSPGSPRQAASMRGVSPLRPSAALASAPNSNKACATAAGASACAEASVLGPSRATRRASDRGVSPSRSLASTSALAPTSHEIVARASSPLPLNGAAAARCNKVRPSVSCMPSKRFMSCSLTRIRPTSSERCICTASTNSCGKAHRCCSEPAGGNAADNNTLNREPSKPLQSSAT
mmetsp:Transcript_1552/g.4594  ORF Transcript_1552/g.4594 Transcript_1552/m.4594 type:complete len:316 (+) Transcript_1552:1206-2153(+)